MRGPIEDISEADWDRVLDLDLKAVFLCCQAEGRAMLQQGSGSIVNVVSISSHVVNRPQLHGHYNAAKAGAYQLTRVCAAEWAARGVRVNSISPGHTLTPMTAHAEDDMKNAWLANTPMGRLGVPADYQGPSSSSLRTPLLTRPVTTWSSMAGTRSGETNFCFVCELRRQPQTLRLV